ncbi:MAG: DUF3592 domain-containing protein [Candidatus Thiodiazotropha sp.]
MFDFSVIPNRPPRSVSLLLGLKLSEILDYKTVFFVVLFVLIMGLFPVTMILAMDKEARLPFIEMEKVQGSVIELVDNSQCDNPSTNLRYKFKTAIGHSYYGDYLTCENSMYSSLGVGDNLPIIYDPKKPSFNGIEGELGKKQPPFVIFMVFPLIFLLIIFPMFLPNLKQVITARSIFKKGQITKGEILFVGRKKLSTVINFKGVASLEIFYSYETNKGDRVESKVNTDNDWLANKLAVGSPVTVVYIESKPKRSIILDFYYR